MTKGAASHGKKTGKVTHVRCRRCGEHAYHLTRKTCSQCGYGKSPKMRHYNWKKPNK